MWRFIARRAIALNQCFNKTISFASLQARNYADTPFDIDDAKTRIKSLSAEERMKLAQALRESIKRDEQIEEQDYANRKEEDDPVSFSKMLLIIFVTVPIATLFARGQLEKHWPVTTGTIIETPSKYKGEPGASTINDEKVPATNSKPPTPELPQPLSQRAFCYRYDVGNRSFVHCQDATSLEAWLGKGHIKENDQHNNEKYGVGKTVTVNYNPIEPQFSIVDPPWLWVPPFIGYKKHPKFGDRIK